MKNTCDSFAFRKNRQWIYRVSSLVFATFAVGARAAVDLGSIRLPPGFRIELVTDRVPDARQMALGRHDAERGTLFVGSRAGKVYAVTLDHGRALEVKTAKDIRNTVGFDWNPTDGSLWFTDNGRDLLGDDIPSDELNRAPAKGSGTPHFGFPYCHQGDISDPEFGSKRPCSQFTSPIARLGAHVAALGMRFYLPPAAASEPFPATFRDGIFIAEHGSWNRSTKVGYRIVYVAIDASNQAIRHEVFAEGWLRHDESLSGRPADVLPLPDGSLSISDELAGAIYRIRYTPR